MIYWQNPAECQLCSRFFHILNNSFPLKKKHISKVGFQTHHHQTFELQLSWIFKITWVVEMLMSIFPDVTCLGQGYRQDNIYRSVREKSRRRDTITQTWYYHTDVILCITQTWYFISDLFYNHLEVGSRVALFKLLKFGPFWTSVCNFFGHFLKKLLFFGPRDLVHLTFWSITQTWYFVWLKYHVSVILHAF